MLAQAVRLKGKQPCADVLGVHSAENPHGEGEERGVHIVPPHHAHAQVARAAARPGAKNYLTGTDLGIPSLEKGKIELTNFSFKPFNLTPTQLSSRYKRVELEELVGLLLSLMNT